MSRRPTVHLAQYAERNAAMALAYAEGATLAEIANQFGITKQHVHQTLRDMPGVKIRPVGVTKASGLDRYLGGAR